MNVLITYQLGTGTGPGTGTSEQDLQHECIDCMPTWNRNRNCNRNVLIAFQFGTGTGTGTGTRTAQNKQLKIIRNNSIKQFRNKNLNSKPLQTSLYAMLSQRSCNIHNTIIIFTKIRSKDRHLLLKWKMQ